MGEEKTQMLKKFVELEAKKRELEAELKQVKTELSELQEPLLEWFEQTGLQSANIDNYTVYIHRQLWAKAADGDYETATAALEAAGLGEYVHKRFNTQSLSAYIRELDRAEEPLPSELEGAIDVSEVFQLRARKSN